MAGLVIYEIIAEFLNDLSHHVDIDYTTNGLLAPNQETPFCELVDDKLIPVFITDSPKDGAVYVTPQGGN